jgi:hypothetical protein
MCGCCIVIFFQPPKFFWTRDMTKRWICGRLASSCTSCMFSALLVLSQRWTLFSGISWIVWWSLTRNVDDVLFFQQVVWVPSILQWTHPRSFWPNHPRGVFFPWSLLDAHLYLWYDYCVHQTFPLQMRFIHSHSEWVWLNDAGDGVCVIVPCSLFQWEWWTDTAKDIISRMLVVDPRDRLSPRDALAHPWIRGTTASGGEIPGIVDSLKSFRARRKFRVSGSTFLFVVLFPSVASPLNFFFFFFLCTDGNCCCDWCHSSESCCRAFQQVMSAMQWVECPCTRFGWSFWCWCGRFFCLLVTIVVPLSIKHSTLLLFVSPLIAFLCSAVLLFRISSILLFVFSLF